MTAWAQLIEEAQSLEARAARLREVARQTRCPARESGGVQCTADFTNEHQSHHHRIDEKDLPKGSAGP